MKLKKIRVYFKGIFFKSFIKFFSFMILVIIFIYTSSVNAITKEMNIINLTTNKTFKTMNEKSFREVEYISSKLAVNVNVRNFMFGKESLALFYSFKDNVCGEIQKYKGINTYIHSLYIPELTTAFVMAIVLLMSRILGI